MLALAQPILAVLARRTRSIACLSLALAALVPSAAQARLRAPRVQGPVNGATVQSLPAFTWAPVRGAAQYEFEFAADSHFSSGVNGFGGEGDRIKTTAITNDRAIPDGTYYWRVRAITSQDQPGSWSSARTLHKAWTTAPHLTSPIGTTVSWPSNPLVLRWAPVPYATKYYVWIATDPALSNLVLGSVSGPQETQGTVFAYPTTLAPGTYYWAITPVDAENDRGPRSRVASFVWTWPSTSTPAETNIATSAGIVDPQFSWTPVPGAASYEVEVNSSQSFPTGSKWCCDNPTPAPSLSPTTLLANGTYYWRVRAIDVNNDAGVWNYGQPFTESFDWLTPTVNNLQLRDVHNNILQAGAQTDTPIVTWDPVPGASSYEIQITGYQNGLGCDWTSYATANTATPAWTPKGNGGHHIGPNAWPGPENGVALQTPGNYCFRLLARRDDGASGGQVVSDWTQLGGFNGAAFDYAPAPLDSSSLQQTIAADYLAPVGGATSHRTPLFTWTPVTGANGYYVVVARDQAFTDVVDVGFSNVTAYAPEIDNKAPYADETTAYWWAVVPSSGADGTGVFSDPEFGQDAPQMFNKSSVAPSPITPTSGANVTIDPTFQWTAAEGARNYRVQVDVDPSFSNPLVDVTTDSTAYTTAATLPANKTLYWRVRANDATDQGLNWSATSSFTHHLPAPAPAFGDPLGGHSIPLLTWTPVTGATAYDMHIDQADGTTRDFTINSPTMTPTQFYGTGIWRWEVRADFPGSNAASAYFSPEMQYVRTIPAPSGVLATKAGTRILISWSSDPDAKQYSVQLSTTPGFGSPIASDTTDNTVWVPQIDSTQSTGTLYWRLAAIDEGGVVGAYDRGIFKAPSHKHRHCLKHRGKRCVRWG